MKNHYQTQSYDLPLLRTKILIPQIPSDFVPRPRLTQKIERGAMGPLTLLAAPAGYGKTNLLIEWAKNTDLPIAWLDIDKDDNDIQRFLRYLIGALQTQVPFLGEEALEYFQFSRGNGLEVGLTLLMNEILSIPRDIVLVMDDFQALEETKTLELINFLLRNPPHNLHLVIASRSQPNLDLALLRARGCIVELGADDLRFTSEEIAVYFEKVIGLQLPADTIEVLEKQTDGWITALHFVAVSMRHHHEAPVFVVEKIQGGTKFLMEFLAEEVLDQQPEEIRQFLLKTSILDTLTGPLCEAVVRPDSHPGYGRVMLNHLEREKLFISALDEKHEWFRYHQLFAEFLRHILEDIHPEEIPELNKRAALWFENIQELDKAFQYALASGDMEWAAELIEGNIKEMFRTGEIFSLIRWVSELSDEMLVKRPLLGLACAWGAIAAYDLDLAHHWINQIQDVLNVEGEEEDNENYFDDNGNKREDKKNSRRYLIGGLAICRSILAAISGNFEQAARYTQQMREYVQESHPFTQSLFALDRSVYSILSGDTRKAAESLLETIRIARQANNLLVTTIAMCELADIQALQGKLNQAWTTLQKAQMLTLGPDGKHTSLVGVVEIGFGQILLEKNSLDEAKTFLEHGTQMANSGWSLSSIDGMISLATLRQAQGDIAGSQSIIMEAYNMAQSTESSQWDDMMVSATAIRLALQRDDLAEAELWWKRGGFPPPSGLITLENYPYHIFEYIKLTQARFLMMMGIDWGNTTFLKSALDILTTLLYEAERFERAASQIEILLLQAMVEFALGKDGAKKTLMNALALGEPEGYQRIYLDEGRQLLEVLNHYQLDKQESDGYLPSWKFVKHIKETISQETGAAQIARLENKQIRQPIITDTENGITISLSDREMEVLALIAAGKSNKEIAAQLFLALNTVKRHVYNIYTKLDVKKRTQAVSRARKLGLMP